MTELKAQDSRVERSLAVSCHRLTVLLIVRRLEFYGWHVAERFEQAAVVEPVDPHDGRVLDAVDVAPWTSSPNHLGLEQADDGLGERVVVRIADASNRAFEACCGEPLGVANADVLNAGVAMVDELVVVRSQRFSLASSLR